MFVDVDVDVDGDDDGLVFFFMVYLVASLLISCFPLSFFPPSPHRQTVWVHQPLSLDGQAAVHPAEPRHLLPLCLPWIPTGELLHTRHAHGIMCISVTSLTDLLSSLTTNMHDDDSIYICVCVMVCVCVCVMVCVCGVGAHLFHPRFQVWLLCVHV